MLAMVLQNTGPEVRVLRKPSSSWFLGTEMNINMTCSVKGEKQDQFDFILLLCKLHILFSSFTNSIIQEYFLNWHLFHHTHLIPENILGSSWNCYKIALKMFSTLQQHGIPDDHTQAKM